MEELESFYQCIEFKKPALILPHDYDQFDYAIRGVEAGIAFQAHRNRTEEIQAGFNALLEKESWEKLERLKQTFKNLQARWIPWSLRFNDY